MEPLVLRLFGPFQVSVDGKPLPRQRTRHGLQLLALLALRKESESGREWLAGTLWPDSDEANGLYYLRRILTQLRRALGTQAGRLLSPTSRTLQLDLCGADCDVLAFDAALARGDLASLEEAV